MSKSVTIPTFMQPDWVCTINNTTYRYKAGTTQTVPDEVAELIKAINAQKPVENPPETPEQMAKRIADAEIETALANYSNYIDLTSVLFTLGTAEDITSRLSKNAVNDIIATAFIKPTGCAVKISTTVYELAAVGETGDHLIFSTPVTDIDGKVSSIIRKSRTSG